MYCSFYKKTSFSLVMLAFLLTILGSCSHDAHFKDGDLIEKYVKEHDSSFGHEKDFHLLCLRFVPLSCVSTLMDYDYARLIQSVYDSVNTEKLYVLCDNIDFIELATAAYDEKCFVFVYDSFRKLDAYAFPFTPHVFRIKNQRIKSWQAVANKKNLDKRELYSL